MVALEIAWSVNIVSTLSFHPGCAIGCLEDAQGGARSHLIDVTILIYHQYRGVLSFVGL